MVRLVTAGTVASFAWLACSVRAQTGWPGQGPDICNVGSTSNVNPTSLCGDFGAGAECEGASLSLAGARGETLSAQLLLRKERDLDDPVGGLRDVSVAFSDLEKLGLSVDPQVYLAGFVFAKRSPRYEGSGGGWRSDPLYPLDTNARFDVPGNSSVALWVDFTVSETDAPGNRSASLIISGTLASGKSFSKELGVALEVWPGVVVPALNESSIGTAWSGTYSPSYFEPYFPGKGEEAKDAFFELAFEHRMPPDSIYVTKPRNVSEYVEMAKRGARWFSLLDVSGLPLTPTQDGEASDSLRQSSHHGIHRHADDHHHPRRRLGSCANYTSEYVERMLAVLEPTASALQRQGLLDRAYVYGFDENPQSCEPQVRKLFGAIKAKWPTLRTVATLNWPKMPTDLPVDIWVLQYQEYDEETAKPWIAAGKQQFWYHCIEPHSLKYLNSFTERPHFQSRALLLLAARSQAMTGAPSGWLYYASDLYNPCQSDKCGGKTPKAPMKTGELFSPFPIENFIWQGQFDDIFANGDGQFVYPGLSASGSPSAVSSIRYKNLRNGLQDWELFRLCPKVAQTLLSSVVRGPTDWTQDEKLLDGARAACAQSLGGR